MECEHGFGQLRLEPDSTNLRLADGDADTHAHTDTASTHADASHPHTDADASACPYWHAGHGDQRGWLGLRQLCGGYELQHGQPVLGYLYRDQYQRGG